ncbi:hypothetical protein D1871_07445 [Nakamurella silvestris]|nr:hypothetical protein D1871_07445 [Nakamurella silvestris]
MEQLRGTGDRILTVPTPVRETATEDVLASVVERLFHSSPGRVLSLLDRLETGTRCAGADLDMLEPVRALGRLLCCDFERGAAQPVSPSHAGNETPGAVGALADGVRRWAAAVAGSDTRVVAVSSSSPGVRAAAAQARSADGRTPRHDSGVAGPLGTVIAFLDAETAMSDGDLVRAEALSRAALDQVTDGSPYAFYLRLTLARSLLFQGQLLEAEDVAAQLIGSAEGIRSGPTTRRLLLGLAHACQALVAASAGEVGQALDRVDRALATGSLTADLSYFRTGVSTLCAFALSAAGEPVRAAAVLLAGSGGPSLPHIQIVDRAFGFEMLTVAALASGDVPAAAGWVQRGAALAAGWPGDPAGMARCALDRAAAVLAGALGSSDRSLELAQNAVRAASSAGGRLEVARALLVAGAAQATSGNRSEAIADLERAADMAGEIGASPVLGQAARGLREFGRRVPPRPGGGFAVLSAREGEIAAHLAAGLSNQQIAGLLHLSVRTVQAHVTRVLRAFGVHSRWAVASAMGTASAMGSPSATGLSSTQGKTPAGPVAADQDPPSPARPPLAGRQAQVASLTALGWSNGRIGGELSISVKTVEKHLTQVYERWGISSRAELAALIHGVVPT